MLHAAARIYRGVAKLSIKGDQLPTEVRRGLRALRRFIVDAELQEEEGDEGGVAEQGLESQCDSEEVEDKEEEKEQEVGTEQAAEEEDEDERDEQEPATGSVEDPDAERQGGL